MAGTAWTEAEVDSCVSAYFEMLIMERKGQEFRKIDFYRKLADEHPARTIKAFEAKCMNISAILKEQHEPFLNGVTPRANRQKLLDAKVCDFLLEISRSGFNLKAGALFKWNFKYDVVQNIESTLQSMAGKPIEELVQEYGKELFVGGDGKQLNPSGNDYVKKVCLRVLRAELPAEEYLDEFKDKLKFISFKKESCKLESLAFNGDPVPIPGSGFTLLKNSEEFKATEILNYGMLFIFVSDEGIRGRDANRGLHRIDSVIRYRLTDGDSREFRAIMRECSAFSSKGHLVKNGFGASRGFLRFVVKNREHSAKWKPLIKEDKRDYYIGDFQDIASNVREFAWTSNYLNRIYKGNGRGVITNPVKYSASQEPTDDWLQLAERSAYLGKQKVVDANPPGNKNPLKATAETTRYVRCPRVIAAVLSFADGKCENCHNDAPFIRSSSNTPYLEVHHIKRLADDGSDRVSNAVAVCPNCHMALHHANNSRELANKLLESVDRLVEE